jgi:predicted O-methyltransferase YrrM
MSDETKDPAGRWTGSGGPADSLWDAVDDYLAARLVPEDAALEAALDGSAAAGLPPIQVSPLQGRFLHLLARIAGARQILEIGTLGGYSTIWLARALLPGGRLVSLEVSPHHAEVARRHLERAGLTDKVEVVVGPALDTLPTLAERGYGPFDLVFIDADKPNNPHYVRRALDLARPGAVIVVDNVVRHGTVADLDSASPEVIGTQEMLNLVAFSGAMDATVLQTVGIKGHDGFLIGIVRG